jgi:hypothetical protein
MIKKNRCCHLKKHISRRAQGSGNERKGGVGQLERGRGRGTAGRVRVFRVRIFFLYPFFFRFN